MKPLRWQSRNKERGAYHQPLCAHTTQVDSLPQQANTKRSVLDRLGFGRGVRLRTPQEVPGVVKFMKILVISHYFASHKGGVEAVADALARAFAEQDHEVAWMAGDTGHDPQAEGRVRLVPFPINNFVENRIGVPFPVPLPRSMKTIVGEVRKADILLMHDCLYLANILAYLVAKLRRIPVIVVQHTRCVPTGPTLIDLIMKVATVLVVHPMLSCAEKVIFIGNTTMGSYVHLRFKTPPELIYNGVNTDLFHARTEAETTSALRSKYGLHEDRPIALFVGRFVRKKGLYAIKRMAALRPNWVWLMAGWGPIDPRKWGLDNVTVFSGLDDPSIGELYRCCDFFILPSVGEGGFPLVVREALVSGMPVVCGEETRGADPGLANLVAGAEVFVDDDDRTAREFLQAIDNIMGSETEQGKLAERQSIAASRFSWDTAVKRYLEIASRLVTPDGLRATESERGAKKCCP